MRAPAGARYTLLTMFRDGGTWMYPLALCSLLALGVIIAKGYTLWAARLRSKSVLAEIDTLARAGRLDEAIRAAAETPGPVAAVLYAGLRRVRERQSGADVEKAIATAGTIELGFLERGLIVLATVSNVAPLLGFLGTVAGMISAFGAIAAAGQVEASLVAGGIKVALITTAAGLLIAIPVNIAYNFFVTRIDQLIEDMEQGTARVLNLMWDMEQAGRQTAPAQRRSAPLSPISPSVERGDTSDRAAQHGPSAVAAPGRKFGIAVLRRRNRPQSEIPTASMADIGFLLLIFFLVTTVFDEERGLRIVLPEPGEEVAVSPANVLHLTIQPNGLVQVKRGESAQFQTEQPSMIGSIWRQEFAQNPQLIAAVRTSPDAPYRYMIDVLDQLQAAKADRISLQMLE